MRRVAKCGQVQKAQGGAGSTRAGLARRCAVAVAVGEPCSGGGARTQVLEHIHVRQRVDLDVAVTDLAQASERVRAVHIHGARAADALAAGAAEGEGRVHLVLDFDQRVEHHRPALIQVDLVVLHFRLRARVRIPPVDGECFHVATAFAGGRGAAEHAGSQRSHRRQLARRGAEQAAHGDLVHVDVPLPLAIKPRAPRAGGTLATGPKSPRAKVQSVCPCVSVL